MNPAYTILKLKSGEELISTIIKKENDQVILQFPMVFKTLIIPDPYSGTQKEITILRDWVSYGKERELSIPSDYIVTYTNPEDDAIELYGKEIEKKFSDDNTSRTVQTYENIKKDMQEELEDLLDDLDEKLPIPPDKINFPKQFGMIPINEEFLREMMKGLGNLGDGESMDFEFDFMIPSEESNPNESTENELNHPDFGNRWTDWSSNPKEY